jgi:hypothetical protein
MVKYYNCPCGATVINKTCHFISRKHIEGLKFVEQQRIWKQQTEQSIQKQKQIASLRQNTDEPTDAYHTTG